MQRSVYVATSLDGFIARRDGRIDWLAVVERAGEDYGYKRFRDSIDVFIVGRKTYETVLRFETWPYAGKRCIVMTHAALKAKHGEEFYCGPPDVLVDRMCAGNAKRAYVDGGAGA